MSYLTSSYFFFNHTATTEIYTLSLHDALPIFHSKEQKCRYKQGDRRPGDEYSLPTSPRSLFAEILLQRSEEHTSELQSLTNLVCRLLLEKKKNTKRTRYTRIEIACVDAVA